MIDTRRLTASMAAATAGKAVTAVAGLLLIMVLTRELGPQEFGYYRTVLTYTALASVLADLGIYLVGLREMSRPDADVASVAGNALMLRLVTTAAVLLLASFVGLLLPYDLEVKRGIFLGALIYTAIQGSEFLVAVFQRAMKQAGSAIAQAVGALVSLLAVWLLAFLDVGVQGMLGATLLGALLTLGISWALARQLVPFRPRFDLALWRRYVVAGLPLAGSHIFTMTMLRGDTLLLSLFQPAADVGLYGVPTKMFELITSLPYLFAGLMMPLLTAAATPGTEDAAPGTDDYNRLLGRSLDAMLMFGIGAMLVLLFFAPQILAFISGEEFVTGAPALMILSVAVLLAAPAMVLRFALVAIDRERRVLLVDGCACAVGLISYLLLIPRFSIVGAATGTAIAEAAVLVGMLWGLRRTGRRLPRCTASVKTAFAGLLVAGALWGLAVLEAPWVLALLVGGVAYMVLLTLTGAIPRDLVSTVLRRPRTRRV
jgi:O-antigen/teichoic acid export membrane protein